MTRLLIAFCAGTLAGLSLWLALRGRRGKPTRIPTADELMAMPEAEWQAFLQQTGMTERVRKALADDEPAGGHGGWR